MRKVLVFVCVVRVLMAVGAAAEKNVVVIITDDQSPTLGCYGDPVADTPRLDELAEQGIRFDRAYATTASCSASRSAVLSGFYNHRNGQYGHVHDEHHFRAFGRIREFTLPVAMARAGYRTAHIGKFHVAPEAAFRFQEYFTADERDPVAMAQAVDAFLADDSEQPFFLYFAPGDPHRSGKFDSSYSGEYPPDLFGNTEDSRSDYPDINSIQVPEFLPDTIETRSELQRYYASCARIDRGVGRLLDGLKKYGHYDETLIIFTSDHGMAFPGAKASVSEAGLSVPLIVRNPYSTNNDAAMVCSALVSLVDLTPTILDFAGALDVANNRPSAPSPSISRTSESGGALADDGYGTYERYQGQSFLAVIDDPETEIQTTLFASHTFHEIQMYYPMRAVWDNNYKLVLNIAYQLEFPLASDLEASATWQRQRENGIFVDSPIHEFIHRPEYELYDMQHDRFGKRNLAAVPRYSAVLEKYKRKLRAWQENTQDPWLVE